MSNKEIVIPISKIKSHGDSDFIDRLKHEAKFDVSEISDEKTITPVTDGSIRVKFPKFLQLIATHDFDEMVEKHDREDVIISSNLLVDLAGGQPESDEPKESRFSWMFLGLVLGLILAAILFLFFIK